MRILVTGKSGQLVSSLREAAGARPDLELITAGRPELDLARPSSVRAKILALKPDLVVNAAAYTAVDRAEDEPARAHAINTNGARAVAEAAGSIGVPIIQISTDYVFSGDKQDEYQERDPTGPNTIYGLTKRDGEEAVTASNSRHLILRTAWVYSPFGQNFVRTMLRLAQTRDTIRVVADQWGNPTSALDLADAILALALRLGEGPFGIFHLAGLGTTNWAGFARQIFAESRQNGGPFAAVEDIGTADFPAKAPRPTNSRLSSRHIAAEFGIEARPWQESVARVVSRILREGGSSGIAA
ncbi:dTDP-4-dehydrorhamnose reductase [Mesorhizobium sp. RP14(2022)]|uniref:dTDP-4-dehydrorhamnose reductase n=1 Tax=Mesorhizobium liriopis TaxID=2953882 RepID=A0ABT1C4Q0_9HYPH|nr:dTDP-4-dehydrorhamnose reductase [Mesorhizobium liriopis]MCO6049111.1 dTDP-4-dehydrorhamnose reductase [Mesorhizobium liriopis]